jgi:hypothetical protein
MSETCHIYSFIKKGFDLFLANVIIICDFYIKFMIFLRWKETALLFFMRWMKCLEKNKCAVCAAGFFSSNVQF